MTTQYLDYIIDYMDIDDSIFKVKVVLSAKVFPDKEMLYNFLYENSIVSANWRTSVRKYQDVQYMIEKEKKESLNSFPALCALSRNPSWQSEILQHFGLCEKDIAIMNSLCAFSKKNMHTFSAVARMFLDFSMGGRQPLTENRALNKIKEQVRELPKLRYTLIEYLKKIGLIEPNRNIYCEVLHKDI